MKYNYPDYYDRFGCIADSCEDTCCAGWSIMIDDKSIDRYKRFKSSFGNRLHNDINWDEQCFKQYNGRCAFLSDDNLCDIYSEAGKNMLCKTCRTYPRHIEEYEGLREVSLSLSCPHAASIILNNREKVSLISRDNSVDEETYEDFDYILFTMLMDSRDYILDTLQDRTISIQNRMNIVLAFAHDIQKRIIDGCECDIENVILRYRSDIHGAKCIEQLNEKYDFSSDTKLMKKQFKVLLRLEHLRENWCEVLDTAVKKMGSNKIKCNTMDEIVAEQLMVYFVYTYFTGAVYDGLPFAKIKLAYVSTVFIQRIYESDKNSDVINIAYRYAREVEHSDINLNLLEDKLMNLKEFTFDNMIKMLVTNNE